MKVTRLKGSVRRPGFVAVFIDGARFALLPVEEVRTLGLREALELDERGREALETAVERGKAYDGAVRSLAARGRSVQEIITRLRRKGLRPDAIDHAVGRLEDEGLLGDAAMALEYARGRAERGFGRARILADLSHRGVARLEAERAVAAVGADDEEERRRVMVGLARKRAAQLSGVDRNAARRRLLGYLARRGYGGEDVWAVVEEVLGAGAADPHRE